MIASILKDICAPQKKMLMADDNVHFQNTVEMANALIKANKQFDTYFYPNRNHGIYGDNATIHLYTKMTNFIFEKL